MERNNLSNTCKEYKERNEEIPKNTRKDIRKRNTKITKVTIDAKKSMRVLRFELARGKRKVPCSKETRPISQLYQKPKVFITKERK